MPKKKTTTRLKPVPKFKSEAEERAFWETHDTANYVDWSKARRVSFPNLKLSTKDDLAAAAVRPARSVR